MNRQTYLVNRIRWTFLLMMRGMARGDARNAMRMERLQRYRGQLRDLGVVTDDIPMFTEEDCQRMHEWSNQV